MAETTREKVEAVRQWQADESLPPLTCAVDSAHPKLMPVVHGDNVILQCVWCGYLQRLIPPVVLFMYRTDPRVIAPEGTDK